MKPWTAVWLAALAVAILVQSGSPSPFRIRVGRGLAAAVGVTTITVLAEYATGRPFGLDTFWFGEAVRQIQPVLPGRPSPQTVSSALFVSVAVALMGSNRRGAHAAGAGCLVAAMVMPFVTIAGYLFDAVDRLEIASSTGMALTTAFSLLLLGVAIVALRPAWLLDRSDRLSLIRLGTILAGFPLIVGLTRVALLGLNVRDDLALTIATTVATIVLGTAAYRRSRREYALRESNESNRMLLRASLDGMLDPQVLLEAVRDSAGEITDFAYRELNQATCDYLGLSREDLLGHTLLEKSPGVAESGLFAGYTRCLTTGEPVVLDDFTYDNEILADTRRYELRATRATPTSITLTWRDVTDRSRLLQRLSESARRIAESERQFRLIAENSGDMVVHIRDNRFVWVSPAALAVLGAPAEHWVGRDVLDVIPPGGEAAQRERCRRVEAGESFTARVQNVGFDGGLRWLHANAKPFYDDSGRQDGAVVSLRRIDDEVAAEQIAEEQRVLKHEADARYRRLMDSSAVGMALLSPDGRFEVVNQAMCDFFGYDADTLRSKTWQQLRAPDHLRSDLARIEDVLAGRIDAYRMRKQYIHADGHLKWGDGSVSCLRRADGTVENFVSQIIDITAQVETQSRVEQLSGRLQSELRSAADYVTSLLPEDLNGEVDVVAHYRPSQELAGDCFDYRWINDDYFIAYLLDVSGHGIEPALLSTSVHTMLRSGSLPDATLLTPEQVLAELNSRFKMDRHGGKYLTMWYGVFHAPTGTLRYASAGHPPAFAFTETPAGVEVAALSTGGMPIGMFEDAAYDAATISVPMGCQVLVYSDGVYETKLADGRIGSLADFLAECKEVAATPGWTLDTLIDRQRALTRGGEFDDDVSLFRMTFP